MSNKFDEVMNSIKQAASQLQNDNARNPGVENERIAKEKETALQSEKLWTENLAAFQQNVRDIDAELASVGLSLQDVTSDQPGFGERLRLVLKRDTSPIGELRIGLTPKTGMVSLKGRNVRRGNTPAKSQSISVTEFAGENGKLALGLFVKDIVDRGLNTLKS